MPGFSPGIHEKPGRLEWRLVDGRAKPGQSDFRKVPISVIGRHALVDRGKARCLILGQDGVDDFVESLTTHYLIDLV